MAGKKIDAAHAKKHSGGNRTKQKRFLLLRLSILLVSPYHYGHLWRLVSLLSDRGEKKV